MLHAHPQLNGNEPRDFMAAAIAMQTCRDQLSTALQVLNTNVLHGRNYQHIDEPRHATQLDGIKVQPLRAALDLMDTLIEDLSAKGQP
jgi:hypothetical protein